MSEWVKGSDVDWEGHAEYFMGHDHLGERQTFIWMGPAGLAYWTDNRWVSVMGDSGVKFRKPQTAPVVRTEWVSGPNVNWTGFGEICNRSAAIQKVVITKSDGKFMWRGHSDSGWCYRTNAKFRPYVDPDGERWRAVMVKLTELSRSRLHHFRLYEDGSGGFFTMDAAVLDFCDTDHLDARLAKPSPAEVTINGNTHSLLPGEAVVDGEFVVTRKEKP